MPGKQSEEGVSYDIIFETVHVNNCPRVQEADESYEAVFPHEARIRNLTYSTEIYLDARIEKRDVELVNTGFQGGELKEKVTRFDTARVFVGKVPVMVRSQFCHLRNFNDQEIVRNAKECVFD